MCRRFSDGRFSELIDESLILQQRRTYLGDQSFKCVMRSGVQTLCHISDPGQVNFEKWESLRCRRRGRRVIILTFPPFLFWPNSKPVQTSTIIVSDFHLNTVIINIYNVLWLWLRYRRFFLPGKFLRIPYDEVADELFIRQGKEIEVLRALM